MSPIIERPKPDYLEDPAIKEKIQDIIYPYLNKKEPVIAIQFGVPKEKEQDWSEAIQYASRQRTYTTTKIGRLTKHRVEFMPSEATEIFKMYELLQNSPHLEIFIDEMCLPYGATLWLPLLWFYM